VGEIDRARARKLLRDFDFASLFIEELGWDRGGKDIEITIVGQRYPLHAMAHKRGLVVYFHQARSDEGFPDHPTRQKIEKAVAKLVREHLIVYTDTDRTAQYWQWVKREPGQPDRCRQHIHHRDHSGESLIQKLDRLRFTLEEEEDATIVEASGRVRAAFDVERITKRFYERFKTEHQAFLDFIEGIQSLADGEWYASLMLNRMMFVYFIQKRGFLDGDTNYLQNRLRRMREAQGGGRFHSFYRRFLLRLFHEGLGQQVRDPELNDLLGRVPYLNGGLFDVHDLERDNSEIHIPDEAFQRIFVFFDQYQWHLDDRPLRKDTEINPDVLGYIFEKYINQKQMGAYYTKEDITGYIGRNTIIPFLFDAAKKECPIAFKREGGVWRLLKDDPDRYFYEAVRHGVTYDIHGKRELDYRLELPAEIAAGIDDVPKRSGWNKSAPGAYALPTEIWREHVARRQRYEEIRANLAAGKVQSINDLITYNLDIEKFARDVIRQSEGPELVRAFWKALNNISVLDPTCGSGAFLFAALNILEPLYVACLEAMRGFIDDLERSGRKHHPETMSDFRKVLARIDNHASEPYFVLKAIVIDNLYGVDIMEEAVEICKLRLFLKLVAQLERYDQIEPLPDIDFNIRAGNTLVGFTSLDEVRRAVSNDLVKQLALPDIEERAEIADRAFRKFREMQTEHGMDAKAFSASKVELRKRLDELRAELDQYLASEYGVDPEKPKNHEKWRASHQPFHWFAEFYGIMHGGGFDVIIGNPPYIEYSKIRQEYEVRNLSTETCGNLYAFCVERALDLQHVGGRFGFIVQAPIVSTHRMAVVRQMLCVSTRRLFFSTYDDRPSKLFDGIHHCRLAIILACKGTGGSSISATTRYHKWYKEERKHLFQTLAYLTLPADFPVHFVPKFRSELEISTFRKVDAMPTRIGHLMTSEPNSHRIYYKITGVGHWFPFTLSAPKFWREDKKASSTRENVAYFASQLTRDTSYCCLTSSLHYWMYQARTNCRDFNPSDFWNFPIPAEVAEGLPTFSVLATKIQRRLEETSDVGSGSYEIGGRVSYQRFKPKTAKQYFDEIDTRLAKHYGFTDDELDFIINYDIKYRMGLSGANDRDE